MQTAKGLCHGFAELGENVDSGGVSSAFWRQALHSYLLQSSRRAHHSVRRVALQLLYLCLDGQPSKKVADPHVRHVRAEALELVAYLQQMK